MPHFTIEIKDLVFKVELEIDRAGLSFISPQIIGLLRSVNALHETIPLRLGMCAACVSSITTGAETDYNYEVHFADGRDWFQHLYIVAGDENPPMIFSVVDRWKVSEINKHRPLREIIINILAHYGPGKITIERI